VNRPARSPRVTTIQTPASARATPAHLRGLSRSLNSHAAAAIVTTGFSATISELRLAGRRDSAPRKKRL